MVRLHLVRHAKAGSRSRWAEDDELRPLSAPGKRQAAAIAERLAVSEPPVGRVLTSRYARCWQTVAPLAERLGLALETSSALAEEADLDEAEALMWELTRGTAQAVLCTHGNVLDELVDRLVASGARRDGPASGKKGSTWVLHDGVLTYVPPPED